MNFFLLFLVLHSAFVASLQHNQRTESYNRMYSKDRSQLQSKIDLLVQEIIGIKSRLRMMTASLHSLGGSLQEVHADIKDIRSNVKANTMAIKGVLHDFHKTRKEMKGLHSAINSLEEGLASSKESTFNYPTSELIWQSQEMLAEPQKIEKGRLMATLPTVDKQFRVSLDFNGDKTGSYGNIMHMTEGGNDISRYGDWIPCIYYNGGVLEISAAVNGNPYFYRTAAISPNTWHMIEVAQELIGEQYFYSIQVDGRRITRVVNNKTDVFHDVKVYASDPWYTPQSGSVRNLIFHSTAQKMLKAKSYYTEYKALFVGFGTSESATSMEQQTNTHTLEECLLVCSTRHELSPRWNGVKYMNMDNICYCVKDNKGHQPTKTSLHYKFMDK